MNESPAPYRIARPRIRWPSKRACKAPPWDCNHLSLSEVTECQALHVQTRQLHPYELRRLRELHARRPPS